MSDLVAAAIVLLDAGFSVLPCGADKKPAVESWKQYQTELMTETEARRCFGNAPRLAVIGGKVSGNLECLDIDDPTTYEPFLELLEMRSPGLPAKLLKRQTPSGGYHLIYRCSEPVAGNLKLACTAGNEVRIETRGEGGYFLSAPSEGYTVISGKMIDCPTLTPEEVEAIHSTAKAFDLRQPVCRPDKPTASIGQMVNGDAPGTRFNQAHSVAEILEAQGWRKDKRTTAGTGWTRPGKDSGTSGVLLENGNFYVWSANAGPLESGRSYDAFGLFTMYNHGGDFAAAARELAGSTPKTTSEEWADPLPLTTHQQADPYPLNALPGIIGEAVKEAVEFVQCPVALGACSALAVVSTVAQGLVDVRRANKLDGPTSLFLLAVADSGERKTTVDAFFSKPVKQWEAEQMEAAKPDLEKFAAELAVWEAKKSGLLAAVTIASKSGKSTDDLKRQVIDLESDKPEQPQIPQLLFGDSTPEETAYRLAHKWPVGGVLSSEAGIVFGGHAMGKESAMRNMALLNGLWDAETLRIDRRSGPSYTVRGVRLTMGLAVQAETVKAFLDSLKGLARGIGFLARFLVAWPESTQGCRMFQDSPEDWPQLAKFHRRFGTLLDNPLAFNGNGELTPVMLELSPDAKKIWVAFHDDVEAELRPGRDMAETKDVASKAADNAARLAALFHLFENGIEGAIGPDHMKSAATVAGWHLYEARRFMGEIALDAGVSNAVKLDAWLIGYCKQNKVARVSTRDIQREGPNCIRTKAILDAALEELTEAGRVRVVRDKQRKNVEINPALLEG
jgi:putative DNA primase/helicase